MIIPDGSIKLTSGPSYPSAWHLQPASQASGRQNGYDILLIESYGDGSHLRIAGLLQDRSRHRINVIRLARDHWRTIALVGHRTIARALYAIADAPPDLIVLSGPADLRLLKRCLPNRWARIPIAAYFHESQWTYPAESLDRLPHLVSHLETLELCDGAWFNSGFHRRSFFDTATEHPSPTVRTLAHEIIPHHGHKAHVLYPPVRVSRHPVNRRHEFTVAWSARWEREKRPDLMLAIVRQLLEDGIHLRLHILGAQVERWQDDPELDRMVRSVTHSNSGYLLRDEYELTLASSDVWLSTAEHEYFGVSAIEATLLGAVPVVPSDLAYYETLPSAISYPPGDVVAAARRIRAIYEQPRPLRGSWSIDAERFDEKLATARFDAAATALIDSQPAPFEVEWQ